VVKISRERDAEVARVAILEAAEIVFAREGFDGARIDTIATESGYNKSLIFHYFGDKEGLYRSIVTRLKARLHTEYLVPLMAFIDSSEAMDASRVRFFLELAVEQYLAFLTEHSLNLRIMAWEAAEGWHTFMVGPIKDEEREKVSVHCLIDFLHRAQQAGIIHKDLDTRVLMINIANMCMMYLLTLPRFQWLLDQPMDDHVYIRQQIVQLILHGILVLPIEGT